MRRSLIKAVLREKYGDVEEVNVDQQVVYLLSIQRQLEERVGHDLVPVVSPPNPGHLEQVQDFLLSTFVYDQFQKNLAFRGHLLFLSVWAISVPMGWRHKIHLGSNGNFEFL